MAKVMRKVRTGSVVRTKQDKTAIVEMVWKQRNRLYRKQVRRIARFYVHDPENQCRLGDVVRIEETRPISKTKHWRLMEILERRQVVDVRPIELESDVEPVVSAPEPVDEAELDDDIAVAEDESEDALNEEVADESADEPEEEPEDEEPVEDTEDEEASGGDSGDTSKDSLEEDNGEDKE